jgi:hypothetical protein
MKCSMLYLIIACAMLALCVPGYSASVLHDAGDSRNILELGASAKQATALTQTLLNLSC